MLSTCVTCHLGTFILATTPQCYNLGQKVLWISHFLTHRTPMLRIWHHSEPFPHPTPIKVVQSGTIMFQQDMHCFCFRDFEIGPKFSETRIFPGTILYPFILLRGLQRDKYFNALNHKNHFIIIKGKHRTVNSLPPRYFQHTNLPTPA